MTGSDEQRPTPPLRAALPLARRLNRNALTVAAALAGITVLTVLVVTNPSHTKPTPPTANASMSTTPTPAQPTFLDQPPVVPPLLSPSGSSSPTAGGMNAVPTSAPAGNAPIPPLMPGTLDGGMTAADSVAGGVNAVGHTTTNFSAAQPSARYRAYQAALTSSVVVGEGAQGATVAVPSDGETTSGTSEGTIEDAERGTTVALHTLTSNASPVSVTHSDDTADAHSYVLRAGTLIPGLLITGINSDLPGNILGQTSRDVYDTRTERQLLIPKGSRLIGTYDNRSVGSGRLIVSWTRLIFPDGQSIDFPRLLGTDIAGESGLHDEVNHHYGRIYGSALLLSIISAGAQLSQPQQSAVYAPPSARQVAAGAAGQELSEVSADNIRKNMDIPPTIIIRPGQPFDIFLMRDVAFDNPYRASADSIP